MSILKGLGHTFSRKPLIVGGRAMEWYGLRRSGDDVDVVISEADFTCISLTLGRGLEWKTDPKEGKRSRPCLLNVNGDRGLMIEAYDVWAAIRGFGYDFLRQGARDGGDYLVVSIDKLMFMKSLSMFNREKDFRDVQLIVAAVNEPRLFNNIRGG